MRNKACIITTPNRSNSHYNIKSCRFFNFYCYMDSKPMASQRFGIQVSGGIAVYHQILRTPFRYFVTHRYVRLRQASFLEVALLLHRVRGQTSYVYISLKPSCPNSVNSRPFSFKQGHIKLSMAGFMPESSFSSFPILPPPDTFIIVTVANPPPYL